MTGRRQARRRRGGGKGLLLVVALVLAAGVIKYADTPLIASAREKAAEVLAGAPGVDKVLAVFGGDETADTNLDQQTDSGYAASSGGADDVIGREKTLFPDTVDQTVYPVTFDFVCPVDGNNPNRCFPGDLNGTYTQQLTYHLFHDIIAGADYHIDLHCGDMTETLAPFCEFGTGYSEKVDAMSRDIALYSGMPSLVESNLNADPGDLPQGLNYLNSVQHGVAGAIVEIGQMGRTDREYVDGQLFCIRNVLRRMGNLAGEAVPTADPAWFTTYETVYAPVQGIFVRCVEAGTDVKAGQKIGEIWDYFGNPAAQVHVPADGRILYLTSSIAVEKDGFLLDMVH